MAYNTRTVNAANELTGISNSGSDWIDPVYDEAGNMISGPKATSFGTTQQEGTRLHFVYDAWNRLAVVYEDNNGVPGDEIASYDYDGINRRIEKTVGTVIDNTL